MSDELLGSFELTFQPSIDLVSVVRRFVGDFYHEMLGPEGGDQLALATHELLENAVKYSINGETMLCIDVKRRSELREVIIRTRNQASGDDIRTVSQLLDEMSSKAPFDFYQTLMRRSLAQPDRSGLGLARIAAEADMVVSYEVNRNRLGIIATCYVPEEDT